MASQTLLHSYHMCHFDRAGPLFTLPRCIADCDRSAGAQRTGEALDSCWFLGGGQNSPLESQGVARGGALLGLIGAWLDAVKDFFSTFLL